jgi:hypothetical protein
MGIVLTPPLARGATRYLFYIHKWASKDYPKIVDRKYDIGPKPSPDSNPIVSRTVLWPCLRLFGGLPLCFGLRPRQETFLVSAAFTSWCFVGRIQFSFELPIPGSSVSGKISHDVASGIRNAILFYSGLFDHVAIVGGFTPSLFGSEVRDRRGAK